MEFFNVQFWQDLTSNALATILGILIGIPVALWIDRLLSNWQEAKEASKKLAVEAQKRRHLLQMFQGALEKNYDLVVQMERELRPDTKEEINEAKEIISTQLQNQ